MIDREVELVTQSSRQYYLDQAHPGIQYGPNENPTTLSRLGASFQIYCLSVYAELDGGQDSSINISRKLTLDKILQPFEDNRICGSTTWST
ncbi:hypothetical protein Ciccas_009436 [Cichlidogyrus casuarinus]|uniref:Uncharacterized protein n=1 Tax=Cichlidogyrus casuarinus TaxID=1844966 RepID=A0ABD2PXI5_9PLAT